MKNSFILLKKEVYKLIYSFDKRMVSQMLYAIYVIIPDTCSTRGHFLRDFKKKIAQTCRNVTHEDVVANKTLVGCLMVNVSKRGQSQTP